MREFFFLVIHEEYLHCSGTHKGLVRAESEEKALGKVQLECDHTAGLFAAWIWSSRDAYHKGGKPLALRIHPQAKVQ